VPNVFKGFGSVLAGFLDEDFVTAWVLRGKEENRGVRSVSSMFSMLYENYKIRRRRRWNGMDSGS
jgi:hypothetical protein